MIYGKKSSRRNVRVRQKSDEKFPRLDELCRAKLAELSMVVTQCYREIERLRRLVGGVEASEDWRRVGEEVCDQRVLYLRCRVCLRVWTVRGLAAERALKEWHQNEEREIVYGDMVDVFGCQGPGCRVALDLEGGGDGSKRDDRSGEVVDDDG